jgi:2-methylcitrate dehydratase PrpD
MNDIALTSMQQKSRDALSQRLADYIVATQYGVLSTEALDAAKLYMLDTLAVSWAGSDAPGCREVHQLLADEGGRADATAWAYGGRLPVTSAAFINGMSASALDYDSIGRGAAVHINIAVLPAALAIAERCRSKGDDFLAALVLGADVMYRLAAALKRPNRGFHYTAAIGVFGAAAAASRLLRLDAETTRHALGIAFIQSSGTQQANIQPSLTKRMLSAFAARAGVYAALLAQRGITAPSDVFEGRFGFFQLYQEGDPAKALAGLGSRFHNMNVSIKKYPSCGCNHTAIEATLKLVRQYDVKPEDVLSIEATITPYIERIVGGEYDPSGDAQVAAQFNIRYSIACALVRRRLGLSEIQESAARDPSITTHIPKISLKVDSTQTGNRGPVTIRMLTRTHGEMSCRVDDVAGGPDSPIPQAEIDDKFHECFGLGTRPLNNEQLELLVRRVGALEQINDMSSFFTGIC